MVLDDIRNWVEEILKNSSNKRDAKWAESLAVGNKEFVMETKAKLGAKKQWAVERSRIIRGMNWESQSLYSHVFAPEKCSL
jgi:hypothetical protein